MTIELKQGVIRTQMIVEDYETDTQHFDIPKIPMTTIVVKQKTRLLHVYEFRFWDSYTLDAGMAVLKKLYHVDLVQQGLEAAITTTIINAIEIKRVK